VALTDRGILPPHSTRTTVDPYEDNAAKTRRRLAFTAFILVMAALVAAKVFHFWPF